MNEQLQIRIGLGILGVVLIAGAYTMLSNKVVTRLLAYKQAHPWTKFFSGRYGIFPYDTELEARGGFKIFTGILALLLGLGCLFGAFVPV